MKGPFVLRFPGRTGWLLNFWAQGEELLKRLPLLWSSSTSWSFSWPPYPPVSSPFYRS